MLVTSNEPVITASPVNGNPAPLPPPPVPNPAAAAEALTAVANICPPIIK